MSEETTDIVVQDETIALGSHSIENAGQIVERGVAIANVLKDVIERQRMYTVIGWGDKAKKHVNVEGWATLGAMLGVTPRTVSVSEIEEGIFEATVELVRANDGAVIGRGIAECGAPDEVDKDGRPIWANRARYARKSMAITRATGKAFRLAFAWIITLAGYSGTPAEEMTFVEGEVVNGNSQPQQATTDWHGIHMSEATGEQVFHLRKAIEREATDINHPKHFNNRVKARLGVDKINEADYSTDDVFNIMIMPSEEYAEVTGQTEVEYAQDRMDKDGAMHP